LFGKLRQSIRVEPLYRCRAAPYIAIHAGRRIDTTLRGNRRHPSKVF